MTRRDSELSVRTPCRRMSTSPAPPVSAQRGGRRRVRWRVGVLAARTYAGSSGDPRRSPSGRIDGCKFTLSEGARTREGVAGAYGGGVRVRGRGGGENRELPQRDGEARQGGHQHRSDGRVRNRREVRHRHLRGGGRRREGSESTRRLTQAFRSLARVRT